MRRCRKKKKFKHQDIEELSILHWASFFSANHYVGNKVCDWFTSTSGMRIRWPLEVINKQEHNTESHFKQNQQVQVHMKEIKK